MNFRKVTANVMVAILVMGTLSAVGIAFPTVKPALAAVSIETSADDHGKAFFGEGLLQVIIEDTSKSDDASILTTTAHVTVKVDSTQGSASTTIDVPDTTAGSQRFEFFVNHVDSTVTPADPETDDPLDLTTVTFGDGSTDLPVTGLELYDDARITITYGSQPDVKIDYDSTNADLTLDRESGVYGSTSLVHLFIDDQDGNWDPTGRDTFTVAQADLAGAGNSKLFTVLGASFGGDVTFTEEGDNTATFEAIIALNSDDTTNVMNTTSDTAQVTLKDKDNYQDVTDTTINDSTSTASVSLTIDDVDGQTSDLGTVTFASELKLTVTDNDQNLDSENDDTIVGALEVTSTGPGGDSESFDLDETGDNTGIFAPDSANDEIKITFLPPNVDPTPGDGILQLTPRDITEDIEVTYHDPLNDNSVPENFTNSIEMNLARPSVDLPETAGVNDDFTVTITDNNLNDNPRTRDAYTINLSDATYGADFGKGFFPLILGTDDLALADGGIINGTDSLATIEVRIEGTHPTFDTDVTETLQETGVNTGIFTVTFDMNDIITSTGVDVNDGDSVEFTFNDRFDDQSHEASDSLSIGKATTGVDFSRTVLPIPPDAGSATATQIGSETVLTTLSVTDNDQNKDSGTEDSIPFTFEDDATTGEPSFRVEIDADGSSNDETISSAADYSGSLLEEILPGLGSFTLDETSKTSGVFEEDMLFNRGSLTSSEWQDLELTVTYIDASNDEESTGITFRGNDGVVSTDVSSVKNGDVLTITVQDEDLNLDDSTAEEFDASIQSSGDYLLAVETEDDDICNGGAAGGKCPTTETFRETGDDTGVFTATYTIGDDLPVTQEEGDNINQASNILITYNDEIDSSGGSGDELEVNVPVVTSTGSIQITPDQVGPGTEVHVLVVDADLNKDSSGVDDYNPADEGVDPNSNDFFVSFTSDRNEVGDGSPEIEETGANTGVFSFDLQLKTDEKACADDDLSDSKFQAKGGSNPEIGACPGDLLSVRYEDEQDASGHSTKVSKLIEVKSFDPTFTADKDTYNVGDKITFSIADPDANRDGDIADSLRDVRIFSDSDLVGQDVSALETGKDTGVFKVSVTTSSSAQGGAITVKNGDHVTIRYTDDFPADFDQTEEDNDFTFTVPIGGGGVGAVTVTAPQPQDQSGKTLTEVKAGQQIILSTTMFNKNDQDQPFVGLIEVRNSDGVTVYLAWQTGTLNPSGQANIGLSWTPDASGVYEVRTFVISSLDKPSILSDVAKASVTVS